MDKLQDLFMFFRTAGDIVGVLALFGITIEVIPIKISPFKWLGDRFGKGINEHIDKVEKRVDKIEYENDMRDLRTTKSRIHMYGQSIRLGEELSPELIKSAFDDLDVYDFYKEKYHEMEINGKKTKINGEVEADRQLLIKEATKQKKK